MKKLLFLLTVLIFTYNLYGQKAAVEEKAAKQVLIRIMGEKKANSFKLRYIKDEASNNKYTVKTEKGKISITGNSPVALTRGAYDYLRNACNSMVSWSGSRIEIPTQLPEYTSSVTSPYKYHYYFNVVTHGYTMPYWDFKRWEKELDWMAVHGVDMPLMSGAYEAIIYRVFKKLGLTEEEINSYFTGPAFFPWNRMGNITGWDGPLPKTFFDKQLALFHKVYNRSKELGMHPIIPAFAGFVPEGMKRIYPNENLRELKWGGFDKKYHAYILEPNSELFVKIGREYIIEWEKEFGKGEFYLADSFNEMDVPLSEDKDEALKELAGFGESVYKSISSVNPDAVWVMQGWTFPYQRKNGKLFWTPERLAALVSKVPDDKLLILDMANEYNRLYWKLDPSWKMYPGFFGKGWVYSFIPNMGGVVPYNGRLDLYASMPMDALKYENKKNLAGFGFAPEGIENNEIIYELLTDMGWRDKQIELPGWIAHYCASRYGSCPGDLKEAYRYFSKSCYGSFDAQPQFQYQLNPDFKKGACVDTSADYGRGVASLLKCKDKLKKSSLYKYDVIEAVAQFLGLKADEKLKQFKADSTNRNYKTLDEALDILSSIDRLLESHPNLRLSKWVDFARGFGKTDEEKKYYEADAKRIVTTWGGKQNRYSIDDYAAKTWSGLIRDYYIPRLKLTYYGAKDKNGFDREKWQEDWIHKQGVSKIKPFADPVEEAAKLFGKYYK
jgi:alpha-N-acetylglucosaminidase